MRSIIFVACVAFALVAGVNAESAPNAASTRLFKSSAVPQGSLINLPSSNSNVSSVPTACLAECAAKLAICIGECIFEDNVQHLGCKEECGVKSAECAAECALSDSDEKSVGAPDGWVLYKQCGQSWSNDELGTAAGTTICDAGCAMSSVAMVLKTKGTDVNPGTLNSWLRNHGGYEGGDELVWASVDAFGTAKMYNYYRGYNSLSQTQLQSFINQGYGTVVNVRNGGHWVLVTGHIDGSTYAVNDPGFSVNSYVYGDMGNFVVYN